MRSESLPVSEIFPSVQGEGPYCGRNALFVRLHFCNLTCAWCDTKYTWLEDSGHHAWRGIDDLQKHIIESGRKDIILTGGEPALHRIDLLETPQLRFHVETNGSLHPLKAVNVTLSDGKVLHRAAMNMGAASRFLWVVSPKLPSSAQPMNEDALHWFVQAENADFKFVIQNEEQLKEAAGFCRNFKIDTDRIWMQLEGRTRQSQLNAELVEKILEAGFHHSPRLHVLYWDGERGK